jgi:hypothetical protein
MGVGTSPYHMHRRKELYGEDASEFRPERWLTGELENIGVGYMPFHYGPRTCLGSKCTVSRGVTRPADDCAEEFALTEAAYAIVCMIQAYPNIRLPPEITPEPVGQEKQILTIVVCSAEGCKVLLD